MKKIGLTIILSLALSVVVSTVLAEEKKTIYKYTDENGVIHYTETKPNDEYEEADLPQLSIVPSAPVKSISTTQEGTNQEDVDLSSVTKFNILEPVQEQNLWGTGGKLTAKVAPLTDEQSLIYQVQFLIDGEKHDPADASTQVFSGIYRGEHTVQAYLVNRHTKKINKKTKKVTFYMHQQSKK